MRPNETNLFDNALCSQAEINPPSCLTRALIVHQMVMRVIVVVHHHQMHHHHAMIIGSHTQAQNHRQAQVYILHVVKHLVHHRRHRHHRVKNFQNHRASLPHRLHECQDHQDLQSPRRHGIVHANLLADRQNPIDQLIPWIHQDPNAVHHQRHLQ